MGTFLRILLTALLIFFSINTVSAETSEALYKRTKESLDKNNCGSAKGFFYQLKSQQKKSINQGNKEFWERLEALVKNCSSRNTRGEGEQIAAISGGGGKADGLSIIGGGGSAEMAPKRDLLKPKIMGKKERDRDRMGSDFANFDLPMADPQLCEDSCATDSKCKAYTYVRPGIQHSEHARCWLKDSVPPFKISSCCVSGVKN